MTGNETISEEEFRMTKPRIRSAQLRARSRGFTLIEILAALLFLAILIPAIVSGLSLANRASVIAERSSIASELAENKLGELLIDDAWTTAVAKGDFGKDWPGYRWELSKATWSVDDMIELRLDVYFPVQGRERSVRFGTLVSATTTQTQS